MSLVFITHNELGLACLKTLVEDGIKIDAIYTRPKKANVSDQTNLREFADCNSIPIHRTQSVNTEGVKQQIKEYEPDFIFVVGWSRLVDQEVLDIPNNTAVGMHPAPLPRGRGRAPIAWSLIKGLDETALSMFHLVPEADAGDLIAQKCITIEHCDDAASLYDKVVSAGADLLSDHVADLKTGPLPRQPQDGSKATWWPKRRPRHGLIDWTQSPRTIYNWIRGQSEPYPGAFSYLDGEKITIWSASETDNAVKTAAPGEIVYVAEGSLGVAAWEGIIELDKVQTDQEEKVPASDLVRNRPHQVGEVFANARDCLETL